MRVAVVNGAIDGERAFPGADIDDILSGFLQKAHLCARIDFDLYDFDLFVVDMAKVPSERAADEGVRPIYEQIRERVNAGGGIICFAVAGKRLSWLPTHFGIRPGKGRRVKIEPTEPYKGLFEKYEKEITWSTQFDQPSKPDAAWQPLLHSLGGWPVAGVDTTKGLVLVLPEIKRKEAFLRDLFDKVIPEVAPGLLVSRPAGPTEPPPDWLADFPIPKAKAIRDEIAEIDGQIAQLREVRDDKDRKARELEQYQGLLWMQGETQLEPIVEKALNVLGIDAHPRRPVDLVHEDVDGPLYIEVEGTKDSIELKKGNQLLGYIANADDPASVRGAIIGNPFRLDHPSERPPPNRVLFVSQLENLAEKQRWTLMTTVELFEYVRRHLGGDEGAGKEARERLGLRPQAR
jgi:hypothetical protein